MKHGLRRGLTAAAVSCALLTGCTTTVTGAASPGAGVAVDVSADDFQVIGAVDSPIDTLARNALADLNAFWSDAYPEFYGEDYTPLSGGYFSVDPGDIDPSAYPATGVGCPDTPIDPREVEGNAFYTVLCDVIVYDRTLLEELSNQFGRFLGPVVMAHEFGHAMQGRFGFSDRQILDETQADCFAGAWTRWVADGNATHVSVRVPDLDGVVRGFLLLRDPVGSDPDDSRAHGSYFDRVSGFYEGFDGGVAACRDGFGDDRVFTAAEFTSEEELESGGNAPADELVGWIETTLEQFWTEVSPTAFGNEFAAPAIEGFEGTAPDCEDLGNRDLGYCTADSTVYIDQTDLAEPAYRDVGDFALATAIALPYMLAVRDQAGLSTDDGAATRSAVCLTGWYEAQWYNAVWADIAVISPGDVDEAVQFLLVYGVDDNVFPNLDASGFELVGAFRTGFLQGGSACDLEA